MNTHVHVPAHLKQVHMNPTVLDTPVRAHSAPENRSLQMQLIPEAMARAQMRERLYEAESERRAVHLVRARRLQRRAERASLRARRALALAVMQ